MLGSVVATQSLSTRAKLVFATVLGLPLALGVTLANTGATVFAIDAEVTILGDGLTVQSSFETGGCEDPRPLEVDEGPDVVRVRTLVEVQDRFGDSCDGAAFARRLTARLDAPLADRILVAVPADPR